jgi:hypothetical protein
LNSTFQGLTLQGTSSTNHVSIDGLVLDGTGLSAVEAASTASGNISMKNFTIRNAKLGAISNKAGSNMNISDLDTLITNISVAAAGNTTRVLNGRTLQMNAVVLPGNASNNAVTWSVVSGTGAAIISEQGLLTAKENGTVTVKATAQDGSGIISEKTITILAKLPKDTPFTPTQEPTPTPVPNSDTDNSGNVNQ